MDYIQNFINQWGDVLEFVYYLSLIVGVFFAYLQLRASTKAQQDLHAPALYIYYPEGTDPINGLVIKNVGNIIATNITINVCKKLNIYTWFKLILCNKKNLSSKKMLPLLNRNDEVRIIDRQLHNLSEIKVVVVYHSPFHNRKIKIKKSFNRNSHG